jgi:hypothetical protein
MAPVLAATKANVRFTRKARSSLGRGEPDLAANQSHRGIALTPQAMK